MSDITPQDLIRPQIRALSAYHVPPAQGLLKLDAMENPYAWPGELTADWQAHLCDVELNRYPDPAARQLKTRLRETLGLKALEAGGPELLLGNGSDELIQLLALAVCGSDRVLLAPEPSFVMYRMIAAFTDMTYIGVPLRSTDFTLDGAAMLAAIERHRPPDRIELNSHRWLVVSPGRGGVGLPFVDQRLPQIRDFVVRPPTPWRSAVVREALPREHVQRKLGDETAILNELEGRLVPHRFEGRDHQIVAFLRIGSVNALDHVCPWVEVIDRTDAI